jgi:DNA processing protein
MAMPLELLSPAEQQLLAVISTEPLRLDALAEKSGRTIPELFDILLNLELKGIIRQVSGQQFVRA